VNHDVLMARVARRVKDKRVFRLIRRYLQAGLMIGGLATARREGTPQSLPLRRQGAGRSRRCCRTSCSTISTRKWNGAVMRSADMPICRYADMPICRYADMPICRRLCATNALTKGGAMLCRR
jgi:retron-type reverse transcriptase